MAQVPETWATVIELILDFFRIHFSDSFYSRNGYFEMEVGIRSSSDTTIPRTWGMECTRPTSGWRYGECVFQTFCVVCFVSGLRRHHIQKGSVCTNWCQNFTIVKVYIDGATPKQRKNHIFLYLCVLFNSPGSNTLFPEVAQRPDCSRCHSIWPQLDDQETLLYVPLTPCDNITCSCSTARFRGIS